MMETKNWLISIRGDLLLLFLPIWLVLAYCFYLPSEIVNYKMSIFFWAIFILGIDVSHVWSTIFRTYFDKSERRQHKRILTYAPFIALSFSIILCSINEYLFWSVLAYYALYHFIKQQYGFFSMYRRKSAYDESNMWIKSKWILFMGVLYPVLFWHLSGDRVFFWFEGGDFIRLNSGIFQETLIYCSLLYLVIHFFWIVEIIIKSNILPIGLMLWILTSSSVWFFGIVWFNSDVVFSLTNVVAHGIPYMVLVFYYIENKRSIKQKKVFRLSLRTCYNVGFMLLLILLFAFVEEYFWDWLVNREKEVFFKDLVDYPLEVISSKFSRVFLISVLSIPQITHYILDGYIWKGNSSNPYIKPVFFGERK